MKRSPSVNKKTMPEGMAKRFDPAGETGDESNRREMAARISSGLFGLAICTAQVGPIDIGAHVFAAHSAIGGALNGRAAIRGDSPRAIFPLRNQTWSNRYGNCQFGH